jgi:hypothetical protein
MGDVINLRQARKQRDRAAASRLAETNRAKFGRTKAERLAQKAEGERQDKQIDGARREPHAGTDGVPPEGDDG